MDENITSEFTGELDIDKIDREYGLIIEDSITVTMTEYDYETMAPAGETMEMLATLSFKIDNEIQKISIDLAHLIIIYKKAKRKGIPINQGDNYNHQAKIDEKTMAQNLGFNIINYIKETIKKEKEQTNFMYG